MNELTKARKRVVRDLLGDAHEAELAGALLEVETAIREWRKGDIFPSAVSERIHRFHTESQEIFKTYNYMEPMLALARAVVYGFITLDQVPEDLRPGVNELKRLFDK